MYRVDVTELRIDGEADVPMYRVDVTELRIDGEARWSLWSGCSFRRVFFSSNIMTGIMRTTSSRIDTSNKMHSRALSTFFFL